jgi:hypothetical protein
MTSQLALLPNKHVRFCDSLLGLAGHVRVLLSQPRTVDELWTLMESDNSSWPMRPRFEYLLLSIDVLFALKQLTFSDTGRLFLVV